MAAQGRRGMSIHQSMLFVGLGGTGCLIGAELERRLREELCGADGTGLMQRLGGQLAPYQLPNCIQFVYADLNENELQRQRLRAAPPAHRAAADRNAHLTTQLVPPLNTYPEVARSLRINAAEETIPWLPAREGEPRVTPLRRGAGQLPTVGRAALFETFRHGLAPAMDPLRRAVGLISNGNDHLMALSGSQNNRNTCDVFVAFSIAGGTGCGIFYDYLHLIGEAFSQGYDGIKIYPLVLMPSAFDEERGGGRPAVLNAGRALLDLFQLVDDQNGQYAQEELDTGLGAPAGNLAVRYPGLESTRLKAGTVQTGFLFSRTSGIEREDLHRSVVSLVMSLIGTGLNAGGPELENAVVQGDLYQSFADSFINEGVRREVPAPSGIGACGVSTSLVASMTVPVDELADIVAGRLLAQAVRDLTSDVRVSAEANLEQIKSFMSVAGLSELWLCAPPHVADPAPAKGAAGIMQALNARTRAMEQALRQQEAQLRTHTAQLAEEFNHARGIRQLLAEGDLFRARRVLFGDRRLYHDADRPGVAGLLAHCSTEPTPPPGITVNAPHIPAIKDRAGGVVKAKWGDPEVQRALAAQQRWFEWRSRRNWHAQWGAQAEVWDRKMVYLRHVVDGLAQAFNDHRDTEEANFSRATRELYRQRSGVSYLLPPQGNLESFYRQVLRRFVDRERLPETSGAAQIVGKLLGTGIWQRAYEMGEEREGGPAAVTYVRDQIKQQVKTLFVQAGELNAQPLLPPVRDLLTRAATKRGASVGEEDLEQFVQKLAGMLPNGFSPEGSGELKVLIAHPGTAHDADVRQYLERMLNIPNEPSRKIEFRAVEQESIVVVLFRSAMSLTEVPEVRQVLAQWSRSLDRQDPVDFLKWRQRLGFTYDWLATTEGHRAYILHRLLCAMWNGQVEVARGDRSSPEVVDIRLPHGSTVMKLPLRPFDRASSWGSLLRAYEEWTLTDDASVRREFAKQLMLTYPEGLGSRVREPAPLYRHFVHEVAPRQVRTLHELRNRLPERSRGWAEELLRLWEVTLPAALDLSFSHQGANRDSLRELEYRDEEDGGYPGAGYDDARGDGWDRAADERGRERDRRRDERDDAWVREADERARERKRERDRDRDRDRDERGAEWERRGPERVRDERDSWDERNVRDVREGRGLRDRRDRRDEPDARDVRDMGPRDERDPRDVRDVREAREVRDERDRVREDRERERREARRPREDRADLREQERERRPLREPGGPVFEKEDRERRDVPEPRGRDAWRDVDLPEVTRPSLDKPAPRHDDRDDRDASERRGRTERDEPYDPYPPALPRADRDARGVRDAYDPHAARDPYDPHDRPGPDEPDPDTIRLDGLDRTRRLDPPEDHDERELPGGGW
ncbi:tubulin-like doman-containing protein [Embleya sp. NPDC020630]|uniref:tubulin-like doman-containing protein n=1 Tax=Embleya sp. NPDC020630 TaxID=3363979 RepID=UPI0037962EC6